MSEQTHPTAAVLIIGDEILSGRTRDVNLTMIARGLTEIGVTLIESRVVPDDIAVIAEAVNALRARAETLFTTGGIGPTHDDLTADAMGRAFGRPVVEHPEAAALMEDYYADKGGLTPARRRMARMPQGAELIRNAVTGAPGFRVENVYIMAGVPAIAESMFEEVKARLRPGTRLQSVSVDLDVPESGVAEALAAIQGDFSDVKIGSYPYRKDGRFCTQIVLRHGDAERLEEAAAAVRALSAYGRSG